jgi:hypothetical protein
MSKLRNLFSAVVALCKRFEVLDLRGEQFFGSPLSTLFLIAGCARSAWARSLFHHMQIELSLSQLVDDLIWRILDGRRLPQTGWCDATNRSICSEPGILVINSSVTKSQSEPAAVFQTGIREN